MGFTPKRALIVACLLVHPALAAPDDPPMRAFPAARGFGARTQAGRGGRIIRVVNLNSEGPGSLREALSAKGPRIVVFEVGGVIDLHSKGITISEPFLTVAGQTAPSPGVTLIRGGLAIKTHDVLLRHLRIRPGAAGRTQRNDWEPEVSAHGPEAHNIIVDHCSLSWAVDESIAASAADDRLRGSARNITFSNCIIAEGLFDAAAGKGPQSTASLMRDNCTNISIIGNLFAHNSQRNPSLKANSTAAVVNNVIYNPGRHAIQLDLAARDSKDLASGVKPRVSIVGNVLIHGSNTAEGLALVSRKGEAYLADNLALDRSGTPAAMTSGLIEILPERSVWPRGLVALPASKVLEHVLRNSGSRPKDRDEVDRRIVSDVRERKGRFISSQDEVGGYPKHAGTRRRLNVPAEDLDEWLAKMATEVE